jgi:uncharacterized protein Usg
MMKQGQMFTQDYSMVTVNVLYFLPDHSHLVGEFYWQTLDLRPKYPRINRFLDYWRREIDAVIKEVVISDMPDFNANRWRNGIIIPIQ